MQRAEHLVDGLLGPPPRQLVYAYLTREAHPDVTFSDGREHDPGLGLAITAPEVPSCEVVIRVDMNPEPAGGVEQLDEHGGTRPKRGDVLGAKYRPGLAQLPSSDIRRPERC